MSHVTGFDSAAFPAWWKLSLWIFFFLPPASQKSQTPRFGCSAIDSSLTLSEASRAPQLLQSPSGFTLCIVLAAAPCEREEARYEER